MKISNFLSVPLQLIYLKNDLKLLYDHRFRFLTYWALHNCGIKSLNSIFKVRIQYPEFRSHNL